MLSAAPEHPPRGCLAFEEVASLVATCNDGSLEAEMASTSSARDSIRAAMPDLRDPSVRSLAHVPRVTSLLAAPEDGGFSLRDLLRILDLLHRQDTYRPNTGNGPMFRGPAEAPAPDFPNPVPPTF